MSLLPPGLGWSEPLVRTPGLAKDANGDTTSKWFILNKTISDWASTGRRGTSRWPSRVASACGGISCLAKSDLGCFQTKGGSPRTVPMLDARSSEREVVQP